MALRREDLTDEQIGRQRALDLSWSEGMRDVADPGFRAHLEGSLQRLKASPPGPVISGGEFLAQLRPQPR